MQIQETEAAQIAAIPEEEQTALITVGVACYNIVPYIARCLDTVCAQTYRNLEILVVDDGSTDTSGAICDTYAENDKRIRVIHQENRGPGGARNRAIEEAKGEYIAFVDGDDLCDRRMIEAMYSALRTHDAQMAVCRYRLLSAKETYRQTQELLPMKADITLFDAEGALHAWATEDEAHVIQNASWNKLYPRDLVGDLRFPERKVYEEILYTPTLLMRTARVCYIDVPLYIYLTDRADSIMNEGVNDKVLRDMIPAYENCAQMLTDNGYAAQADAMIYLLRKKLLLYYNEARKSKNREKRACMKPLKDYLDGTRKDMERIYACDIADPHEKMRMRLFFIHPILYNRFMDINEGIVLPLRRRLHQK